MSELTEPRHKKNTKLLPSLPLPVIEKTPNEIHKFSGYFDDFSVVIEDGEEMREIVSMGYFGKANLSRTFPLFLQANRTEIVRERVFKNREKVGEGGGHQGRKVVVVPDSDDEDEHNERYFTNLRPEYRIDASGIKEKVHLAPEEAFFLAAAVQCLNISHNGRILQLGEIWQLFADNSSCFIPNYIVYYHFRAKNWVVKPGIKFGGDYLLYKQGPPFYHASYVVVIRVVDENLDEIAAMNRNSTEIVHLMGMNRLCETSAKELLICDLVWPSGTNKVDFDSLDKFSVRETIMKRWNPEKDAPKPSTSRN